MVEPPLQLALASQCRSEFPLAARNSRSETPARNCTVLAQAVWVRSVMKGASASGLGPLGAYASGLGPLGAATDLPLSLLQKKVLSHATALACTNSGLDPLLLITSGLDPLSV